MNYDGFVYRDEIVKQVSNNLIMDLGIVIDEDNIAVVVNETVLLLNELGVLELEYEEADED